LKDKLADEEAKRKDLEVQLSTADQKDKKPTEDDIRLMDIPKSVGKYVRIKKRVPRLHTVMLY
jgi:hypothetical protein